MPHDAQVDHGLRDVLTPPSPRGSDENSRSRQSRWADSAQSRGDSPTGRDGWRGRARPHAPGPARHLLARVRRVASSLQAPRRPCRPTIAPFGKLSNPWGNRAHRPHWPGSDSRKRETSRSGSLPALRTLTCPTTGAAARASAVTASATCPAHPVRSSWPVSRRIAVTRRPASSVRHRVP